MQAKQQAQAESKAQQKSWTQEQHDVEDDNSVGAKFRKK
jgi:hypothetical protein